MIDAGQWATRLLVEQRAAVKDAAPLEVAFLRRAELVTRQVQLDTISQCLRLAHGAIDAAPRAHQSSLGALVDLLADLAIAVEARQHHSATDRRH